MAWWCSTTASRSPRARPRRSRKMPASSRRTWGREWPVLTISALEAGYGKTKIIDGLSFQVETGAIVALLGGNGTGKSTALKTIAGLLAPSGGSIDFDGRRIDGLPAHRLVPRALPDPRGPAPPDGGDTVGRRAADARHRAGAHVTPQLPDARRAVGRARAESRGRRRTRHSRHPRSRADDPARRAERGDGAGPRPLRLRPA